MHAKTLLKMLACCFLTVYGMRTQAQTNRETAGRLLLNQPRTGPGRDRSRPPLFIHSAFRTYDGTSNNISSRQALEWGSADIALYRELPPQYGSSDPNNAMAGANRPSPRQISNLLCDEPVTHFNERN